MDSTGQLSALIKKIEDGSSTPEEELEVLEYLNDAAKLLVIVANSLKAEQLKNALISNNN